jgi:hypothetical protein
MNGVVDFVLEWEKGAAGGLLGADEHRVNTPASLRYEINR